MQRFLALLLLVGSCPFIIHAQTPSPGISEYPLKLTDTITCASKEDCARKCEDPVLTNVCFQAAKNAGIVKSDQPQQVKISQDVLSKAAVELGCGSKLACQVVCSVKENFQKCNDFAKKYSLKGGYDTRLETDATKLISLAGTAGMKEVSDLETLKTFCDRIENRSTCTEFANQAGLLGGITNKPGPGGCVTPESCQAYCNDPANFSECKTYNIKGFNNCTSELSCYQEIQNNFAAAASLNLGIPNSRLSVSGNISSSLNEIINACTSIETVYQGKSIKDFTDAFEKTGACTIIPKNTGECNSYLSSGSAFDKTAFEAACTATGVVPPAPVPKVSTIGSQTNGLDSVKSWCQNLTSIGTDTKPWNLVPQLCTQFVATYQSARTQCASAQQPDTLTYLRYCLSVPQDMADYSKSCQTNQSQCQNSGYDWYCALPGKSCSPLYEGAPLTKVAEEFTQTGVASDDHSISVLSGEHTAPYIAEVLSATAEKEQLKYQVYGPNQVLGNITPTPTPRIRTSPEVAPATNAATFSFGAGSFGGREFGVKGFGGSGFGGNRTGANWYVLPSPKTPQQVSSVSAQYRGWNTLTGINGINGVDGIKGINGINGLTPQMLKTAFPSLRPYPTISVFVTPANPAGVVNNPVVPTTRDYPSTTISIQTSRTTTNTYPTPTLIQSSNTQLTAPTAFPTPSLQTQDSGSTLNQTSPPTPSLLPAVQGVSTDKSWITSVILFLQSLLK